jgi:hypothetical protein
MRAIFPTAASIMLTCCFSVSEKHIQPLNPLDNELDSRAEIIDHYNADIHGVGQTTIDLYHIPDWTDPGDFLKIKISNSKYTVEYSNIDGWVTFNNNYLVKDDIAKQNELESEKILLITNGKIPHLVLFGWVYESSPGLCTIIDLASGKIVFNDEDNILAVEHGKFKFQYSFQR